MRYDHFAALSAVALGQKKAQLVFKGAKVLNVFTEELVVVDVAVENGTIAGVGDYEGETQIDCRGKYIAPGFIDAHLHLESTMVTPNEIVYAAAKHGTTTFIVDPHEAVNVAGEAGLSYMLDQTANAQANVYIMLPSCVPATPYEDNGCAFTAELMEKYIGHERVLGLGEVMDYVSVVNAQPGMMAKLELFKDKIKDGHAPGLSEKQLSAYALADIKTDHECTEFEYAKRQIANGMHVHIREGSGARNLEAIVKGVVSNNMSTERFSFCTDDKHIDDILKEGHISHNIRKSIALGIQPVKAYKMATINTAICYGLKNLGAIAPGYQADLVVLDDFEQVKIGNVFHKGREINAKDAPPVRPCPEALKHTVNYAPVGVECLRLKAEEEGQPVINFVAGQIITRKSHEKLPAENGFFMADAVYNKLVVVERHKATGKVAAAAAKGFSLKGGAIATSVSHDSHNIIAIGDCDSDILLAIETLGRMQGGYALVKNGAVAESLPLPIMGLMSDAGYDEVEKRLRFMITTAHEMGVPEKLDPFVVLSFAALAVIPEIRLLAQGLFDVQHFAFM
ncbi:adenine deaminase [Christensenellaceae bacterium OttesenSCG-928-M15]|nr:adenine deaminase [Christensenellaceae bacterium OttesenSCG-928-M15]